MRFLVLSVHLLALVLQEDVLDLAWVEADLATKGVRIASIALEEHNRGPVLATCLIVRSLVHEASIDLVSIDLQLELVDATSRRLRIVPQAKGSQGDRLLKQEHDAVGLALLGSVFLADRGGARVTLGVLVGGQPDVVVACCLVLPIDKVVSMPDIVMHPFQCVHASRIRIDSQLVFASAAHIVAVLVVELDSVEADVEEIAVRRVQVDLE